jgi:hypothetical protein
LYFHIDEFPRLSDLVKIDATKRSSPGIEGANTPQKLERIGSRRNSAVVTTVPDLDSIEFGFDGTYQIDTTDWRMCKDGNAPGIVYAVHQTFDRTESHSLSNTVSKNVNRAAFQGELKAWNDEKGVAGERFTKVNVFLHPPIVEHFGVIADGCELHAGLLKDFHQSFKRFLPIRKSAVDVKYSLCEHLDLKHLPRDLEHLFDFGGNLRLLNVLRFMRNGPQADKSQVQDFNSCDRRCKDHPCHTDSFVDAHFPLRKIQLT